MRGSHCRPLTYVLVLFGVMGMLLFLLRPMSPVGAQDFRVMQVWPNRSIGVTSGLLEGSEVQTVAGVFPFGAYRGPTENENAIQGRTYLHFPLNVFPPGTEIVQATLYVYVDSSSSKGRASFGAYRVQEPWRQWEWSSDPTTWPAVAGSALAVAEANFTAITPTSGISLPTATPAPVTVTAPPTGTPVEPTVTSPVSPLSTPRATLSPTPSPMPSPTPRSTRTHTLPDLPLEQVAGTWLTWDVTVLMISWMTGEVDNEGLALALAPDPDVSLEIDDGLLVARWLTANDVNMAPHLIVEFEVHPVTPTFPPSPLSTPSSPVLPPAGRSGGWRNWGALLVGAALLLLGLIVWRRQT